MLTYATHAQYKILERTTIHEFVRYIGIMVNEIDIVFGTFRFTSSSRFSSFTQFNIPLLIQELFAKNCN